MSRKPIVIAILHVTLIALLAGCDGAVAPQVAQAPAERAATTVPPTETPIPTSIPPTATVTPLPAEVSADTKVEPEAPAVATDPVEPTAPPEPTASPEPPTPEPEPADWLASVGRTDEGLMYLGNPAAPISLTDYSDFM